MPTKPDTAVEYEITPCPIALHGCCILAALFPSRPVAYSDIYNHLVARRMDFHERSYHRDVLSLVKQGYVRKVKHPDGYPVFTLTPKGTDALKHARESLA